MITTPQHEARLAKRQQRTNKEQDVQLLLPVEDAMRAAISGLAAKDVAIRLHGIRDEVWRLINAIKEQK